MVGRAVDVHKVKTLRSQGRRQLPACAGTFRKTAQTIRECLIENGYPWQRAGLSMESAARRRGYMDLVARRQPSRQADDVRGVATAIPVMEIGK
jgi:hypothetical protein